MKVLNIGWSIFTKIVFCIIMCTILKWNGIKETTRKSFKLNKCHCQLKWFVFQLDKSV